MYNVMEEAELKRMAFATFRTRMTLSALTYNVSSAGSRDRSRNELSDNVFVMAKFS